MFPDSIYVMSMVLKGARRLALMVALSVDVQMVEKCCLTKLNVSIFKSASLRSIAFGHLCVNFCSLVSTSAFSVITFCMASSLFLSIDDVQRLHLLHRKAMCTCRCVNCLFLVAEEVAISASRKSFLNPNWRLFFLEKPNQKPQTGLFSRKVDLTCLSA